MKVPKSYVYLGGTHKVSLTIDEYESFQYPSEQFLQVKLPVYSVGYDKLGKRKKVSIRSKKQLLKIFQDLKVNPLKYNKLITAAS
jgi:hypothetical protein